MATAAKSVLCIFLASFISATQLHAAAQAQEEKGGSSCPCQGNAQALAALQPQDPYGVAITRIPNVGYGFYFANASFSSLIGGPNVTRGLVILPEQDIAAEAYAPYALGVTKNKWAIGGHSNGGLEASLYAKFNGGKIYALVMHAGGFAANLTTSTIPVAQIYGTLDNISPGGYDRYRYRYVDPPPQGYGCLVNLKVTKFIPIKGANHCQVGDYGYQYPDDIAIISIDDQKKIFAQKTVAFLDAHCCQSDDIKSGIRDINHEVLT